MTGRFPAACAGLLLLLPGMARAADWVAIKTVDGITVSKRDVPGSPVVAFKGEGDVEGSLELVSTVIFDCTRATEWIADLKASRIVRWTGPDEYIEYDHVGTPPVMKDRDFVSDVKLETDRSAQKVLFHYRSTIEDSLPPIGKYVRGDLMSTVFTLTRIDDTHTHVIAEIHCDPKGSVPKWVVNWVQADWPEQTFRGLRRQTKKNDLVVEPYFRNALSR
jgi:START domain